MKKGTLYPTAPRPAVRHLFLPEEELAAIRGNFVMYIDLVTIERSARDVVENWIAPAALLLS